MIITAEPATPLVIMRNSAGLFYIKCVILSLVAKPSLGFIRAVSKDMALIFLPKKRTKAQTTLALTKILEMVICY